MKTEGRGSLIFRNSKTRKEEKGCEGHDGGRGKRDDLQQARVPSLRRLDMGV